MAVSDGFADHVLEMLAGLGAIRMRKMFGGAGVYRGDLMFALIVGDDLYLKTDDDNRAAFEAAGSEPFVFSTADGRRTAMSYWRLPAEAEDDAEAFERWGRVGLDAALRAKRPKGARQASAADHDIGSGPWDQTG